MNDHDLNVPDDRDELYELLCAYLLGETNDEQSARVEAALTGDPALRAERARLAATLELVRDHGGAAADAADVERIAVTARAHGAAGPAPSAVGLGDSGLGDSGLGDSGLGDSGFGESGFGGSGLGDAGYPRAVAEGTDAVYRAGRETGADLGPAEGRPNSTVLPFHRRPAFRIAAGFVGLASAGLIGLFAAGRLGPREAGPAGFAYDLFGGGGSTEMASAERSPMARASDRGAPLSEAERRELEQGYLQRAREELERLGEFRSLGYTDEGAASEPTEADVRAYAATLEQQDLASAPSEALQALGYLQETGSAASGAAGETRAPVAAPAPAPEASPPAEPVLAEAEVATSEAPFESQSFNDVIAIGGGAGGGGGKVGGRRAGRARAAAPSSGGPASGGPASGGPASGGPAPPARGVGTNSGDFSLGVGLAGESGTYRGPGDSAPPTRRDAVPADGAASADDDGDGETTAGYRGPSKLALPESVRRQLEALGYGGGDDPALLDALLESLGLAPAELPDLLEALGYLPTGYTGDLSDDVGRSALTRFVDAKRLELERAEAERRLEALLADCRRRPGESLRDMFFRHWGQRPFVDTAVDPLSTFAADVDTASYALARRMLLEGVIPTKAQIRTEEFVNYFDADLEPPREGTFAIHTDLGPAEFAPEGSGTWMLRVGVAGRVVEDGERKPLSLTFVVDTSGSMRREDRIELVKSSLRQLLTKLDSRDELAIVRFSSSASVVLPPTNAANRGVIEAAILSLEPSGSTNVEQGLNLGYDLALQGLREDANNRVVFLSDGVGNVGETDQARLVEQVADRRAKGIYLNTIGFGLENHNDVLLEQLADEGDGLCNYVDSALEARRALVENFTGAFETIARDVKLQVEFDPARVRRYRLLGYENRAIADREFTNDAVDAGEIGAGHTVVALYELEGLDLSDEGGPLATVRVRYKPPFDAGLDRDADEYEPPADEVARQIEAVVTPDQARWSFEALPTGFAMAQCAAQLAEVLRRSAFTRGDSLPALEARALWTAERTDDEAFREFAGIVSANRAALEALIEPASPVQASLDALKYLRYELEREREADGEPDPMRIAALEARIAAEERSVEEALRGAGGR